MGLADEALVQVDQRGTALARSRTQWAPTVTLLLAGLLLPNALSLATFTPWLDVGLPPRPSATMLYAVVAISARRMPFALTALLFLSVLACDLLTTISRLFGFSVYEFAVPLEHAHRVQFLASPLYAAMTLSLALTTTLSLMVLRRRDELARGNLYVLTVGVLTFVAVDLASNTSAHFDVNAMFAGNKPVRSAIEVSGFGRDVGVGGRNVLVVLVESLGYLRNPQARNQIAEPLLARRVTDKYVVTSGSADYAGSTTSGEMRELCGTRVPYADFARETGSACLPSRLKQLGYTTLAVHGFSRHMFDRVDWYPQIGIDKAVFGENLLSRVPRRCGNAFRSVCDADLAPLIARESAFVNAPRFIYWLTLNTHVPVGPGDALTNYDCEVKPGEFETARVCWMAELWHDLFAAIARLALDPAIAPAEILVVGDHAPPLWSKRGRGEFEPGKVAWYRLTPRASH